MVAPSRCADSVVTSTYPSVKETLKQIEMGAGHCWPFVIDPYPLNPEYFISISQSFRLEAALYIFKAARVDVANGTHIGLQRVFGFVANGSQYPPPPP